MTTLLLEQQLETLLTVNSTTTFQNGVTFNGTDKYSGSTSQTGKIQIDS